MRYSNYLFSLKPSQYYLCSWLTLLGNLFFCIFHNPPQNILKILSPLPFYRAFLHILYKPWRWFFHQHWEKYTISRNISTHHSIPLLSEQYRHSRDKLSPVLTPSLWPYSSSL